MQILGLMFVARGLRWCDEKAEFGQWLPRGSAISTEMRGGMADVWAVERCLLFCPVLGTTGSLLRGCQMETRHGGCLRIIWTYSGGERGRFPISHGKRVLAAYGRLDKSSGRLAKSSSIRSSEFHH
jgi:hypothetical protein